MGMVLSPERIREARKNADLSLREAARRIPASKTSIVNAEAGATVPGGDLLGRMASTFGVPVDFFFDHVPERNTRSTGRGDNQRGRQVGAEVAPADPTGA